MKKDYKLIENTWENNLAKHRFADSSLLGINISEETKYLLEYIGLPIIHSKEKPKFLPFTFYHSISINDKVFYLLGDISSLFVGIAFLGLEIGSEKIYYISQDTKNGLSYEFFNESLYQYLMCLATYIIFLENEPDFYSYPREKIRESYQRLRNELITIDKNAIGDVHNHWAHLLYNIEMEIPLSDENLSEPISNAEFPQITGDELPF